jgi:hypothetical protein
LGLVLFLVGIACIVGVMTCGVESHSRLRVWFRGAMQRRSDYTALGWRVYRAGVAISVVGVVVIVPSFM